MKKSLPEKLPPIISRILQKLDTVGDAPLILANDDIPLRSMPVIKTLAGQGLLSACIASHVACINCEAQAGTIRTGSMGKRLFASCNACGSHFRISEQDAQEFQITWSGLACWLTKVMVFSEEPEPVTENVYFLGHHKYGSASYEIHLMKGCAAGNAKQDYKAVIQQQTNPAIILSLSQKPSPCVSGKVRIITLAQCLGYANGHCHIKFPTQAFSGVDPVKQMAGLARVANSPIQKQKDVLRDFLMKNLQRLYTTQMHQEIAQNIIKDYTGQITYQDKEGNSRQLSSTMVRDVVKGVLEAKGLSERISGRKAVYA